MGFRVRGRLCEEGGRIREGHAEVVDSGFGSSEEVFVDVDGVFELEGREWAQVWV